MHSQTPLSRLRSFDPRGVCLLLSVGLAVALMAGSAALAAADEAPAPVPLAAAAASPILSPAEPAALEATLAPGPFGRRLLRLPFLPLEARIMFVLDGSNSQEGMLNLEMKKAARRMLRLLDVRSNANVELGVVQFDKKARVGCRLMQDERRLIGCINQVRQRLGTNVVAGLREAYKEIVARRESPGVPADEVELIVLFSDGLHRGSCDDVVDEAHSIKANGIRVMALAVGPRADLECLADVVTTRADLYQIATHVRVGD